MKPSLRELINYKTGECLQLSPVTKQTKELLADLVAISKRYGDRTVQVASILYAEQAFAPKRLLGCALPPKPNDPSVWDWETDTKSKWKAGLDKEEPLPTNTRKG